MLTLLFHREDNMNARKLLSFMLAFTLIFSGQAFAGKILWEKKVDSDVRFKVVHDTGIIVVGTKQTVYGFDPKTGEEKWKRETKLKKSHKHRKGSWASSTPATDGEHVYVEFADEESYMLICYDFKGNKIWERDLGSFTSQHGHGSSPMIYKNLVIATNDQQGPSSVTAFNKLNGEIVWKADRAVRRTSYATPIIVEHPNTGPQLICVSGATGISSLDPENGKVIWTTGEFPMRTVSSPVYGEGLIFATCGGGGRGMSRICGE